MTSAVVASVWPRTSRVSRSCGVTSIQFTEAGSSPLAMANSGNMTRLDAADGEAIRLPARSRGCAMFDFLSDSTSMGAVS